MYLKQSGTCKLLFRLWIVFCSSRLYMMHSLKLTVRTWKWAFPEGNLPTIILQVRAVSFRKGSNIASKWPLNTHPRIQSDSRHKARTVGAFQKLLLMQIENWRDLWINRYHMISPNRFQEIFKDWTGRDVQICFFGFWQTNQKQTELSFVFLADLGVSGI